MRIGGPHNLGYVSNYRKDLYNFSYLNRKAKIADGDANVVIQFYETKANREL